MPLQMYTQKKSKIIAVAAGKGGVGKSTLTVNLALALQHMGHSVGIMDTDLYGPSIRKMLPEDRMPGQKGSTIIPALCNGIRMISMAYFRKEHEAAVVRAPIANGLIKQFIQNVDWGPLDYLLIDFPPGTGDIQLTLSQHANLTGAVMITTPQEVAVMDVRKAMHMFEQVNVPVIGVVENMSYYTYGSTKEIPVGETLYLFGKGGGERLARESGVPFLGEIPIIPALCKCGDSGHSLFSEDHAEYKQAASIFVKIAEQLVGHIDAMETQTSQNLHSFELSWKEM